MNSLARVIIAFSLILLVSIPCSAQIITTFDSDEEGWMITGDNDFGWGGPTGGNPGGYLNVADLATGARNWAVPPSTHLGDWSAFTSADSIAYEVYWYNTEAGTVSPPNYVFEISGPGGSAAALNGTSNYPPQYTWTRFVVSLDPADWTLISGTWAGIMQNVTSLRLNAEYWYGDEEVRIDNISLLTSSLPLIVYMPCVAHDFNTAGTGDWTAQGTTGIINPGSGGHSGGFLQVGDNAGATSYLYAPAVFLGDWSTFEGVGHLTLDIRVSAYTGNNLGAPEFVRISGPGGSAYVSLAPGDIPTTSYIWKTFNYPLEEPAWTVDSGTWGDLLDNVTECRILVEYFDGTETVGMDNFGRRLDTCGPIDDPIGIYDPDVTLCDQHSLPNIYNAAYNPMDGELYAVVRAETYNGGGLYAVTGPSAGTRVQEYDRPAHLIFDDDGDCYISEDYSGVINRLEWGGASSIWVSGFHGGDDDPFGMTFALPGFNGPTVNEGDILVTDRGSGGPDEIWSFSPDTPENEQLLMPDPGEVDEFDLAAGSYETVYVCDALYGSRLVRIDTVGVRTHLSLSPSLGSINSIVYDTVEDDIYVADGSTGKVHRVDPSSGAVTLVADGFVALQRCCLEIDPATRRLWVTDGGALGRVYELCIPTLTHVEKTRPRAVAAIRVFPNPFNPATTVSFTPPVESIVSIVIYNVTGSPVRRFEERLLKAVPQEVVWDGRDDSDQPVGSGVYFVQVSGKGYSMEAKLVLLK
jgi:hypothetical protein